MVFLSWFIRIMKVSFRLTLIQKGWLVSFKVTSSNSSVFIPLQEIEGLHNYMGNKNQGSENKIILRDFNCTMDKMGRGGGNKTQILYRFVPIMPCQNSLWIIDSRVYRKGWTQITEFTRYDGPSVTRSRRNRVYANMKYANSTKINHIMVPFTDLYNAISIDRLLKRFMIL